MKNRSVPVDTVLPHVSYRDLPTAIDWLVKHFGFVEQYHYVDTTTGTSAAEGVAADAAGNVYGAEVGPKRLMKYVKN